MSSKVKCSHILVEKQSQALEILEKSKKVKNLVQLQKKFLHVPAVKKKGIWDILQKE